MFGKPCFQTFSKLFDPKTVNYLQTFFAIFLQFKKTGYLRKISELRKTNFSVTRENEKFGNFCLTQGLSSLTILHTTLTRHEARSYAQLFSTCGRGQLFFQATLKTNLVFTDQYWHHKA